MHGHPGDRATNVEQNRLSERPCAGVASRSRHLSVARNIIVVGYSLSASDQFFRYLYALGTVGATRIEKFLLVDPDKTVKSDFKLCLARQ